MNPFDAAVTGGAILGIALGFHSGLLRSLATILAYGIAAPIAIAITPGVTAVLGRAILPPDGAWVATFVMFAALGLGLSALTRSTVAEFSGPEAGLFDRLAGAGLGALRIFMIAVLIVIVFDRVIPAGRQPAFLTGSRLRPYLTAAGQAGVRSLPPEVEDYIDRIKRNRAGA